MITDATNFSDDEDIVHWQKLVYAHQRTLRIFEMQAAKWGKLHCPTYIVTSIEDAKKEIDVLEQKIRRRIRISSESDGRLYTEEEIDEIIDNIEQSMRSRFAEIYRRWYKSPFLRLILYMFFLLLALIIGELSSSDIETQKGMTYFLSALFVWTAMHIFERVDQDEKIR